MYGSASISEILQNHQCGQGEKKTMGDIHDSPSWKRAFSEGKICQCQIYCTLISTCTCDLLCNDALIRTCLL